MRKECSSFASTSDSPSSTLNRVRMVSTLEMEDDEEMTTTDDDREMATKMRGKPGAIVGEEEEEEEDEEEEEKPLPEALALTRTRRPNAGRRMAELMAQQNTEKDDFYGTLYGGFEETEQDEDFASPPHSSDEEAAEDEVDSDFDKDEEEDDNEDPVEEDPEQIERRRKRLNQKRLLEHNKNWAIARINRKAVPENACDPKTQRQRLEEAKQTAELNIASLKRFEDMELERRRRQQKPTKRRALDGPRVRELWTANGQHLITFVPEPPPANQCFPKLKSREFRVCAISGQPARYIDPVTRLPYADTDAFRVLREKYRQFLETEREMAQQQQRKKS